MNPEMEALLNKANQSLLAAKSLSKEGFQDFAAARAYYAMFYAAQALLLARGLSYSSHAAVIAAFGKEFAKTGDLDVKYHRYLIDAQDIRNLADYGLGPEVSASDLKDFLAKAQDFLTAARAWPGFS
jgi:uncharacterized protein (UPF0332 family)